MRGARRNAARALQCCPQLQGPGRLTTPGRAGRKGGPSGTRGVIAARGWTQCSESGVVDGPGFVFCSRHSIVGQWSCAWENEKTKLLRPLFNRHKGLCLWCWGTANKSRCARRATARGQREQHLQTHLTDGPRPSAGTRMGRIVAATHQEARGEGFC